METFRFSAFRQQNSPYAEPLTPCPGVYCINRIMQNRIPNNIIVHRDIYEFVISLDATAARGVRLKLTRFHNEIPI